MLAQQRYDRILELLNKNGIVHNAELVKEMKVSSETVRKDMDALEKQDIEQACIYLEKDILAVKEEILALHSMNI